MSKSGLSEYDILIWRYVRDAGGWHSMREIAHELALDKKQKMALRHAINRLVKEYHIEVRPSPYGEPRWGVTARCEAPPGLSLTPDD